MKKSLPTLVPVKTKRSGNRRTSRVRAVIEDTGFENILDRIRGGESQSEIARALHVHVSTLNRYLNEPSRTEETEAAKRDSAESWLDRGTDGLEDARGKDAVAVQWARANEQHCARRAAIRNPARYSEKHGIEVTGADGGPVQTQSSMIHVYLPDNGRKKRSSRNKVTAHAAPGVTALDPEAPVM